MGISERNQFGLALLDGSEFEEKRFAQLARNLEGVRDRIAAACAAAGRPGDSVTLVAVSKFFPAADVLRLMRLGQYAFGENRDQEASAKAQSVAAEAPGRAASGAAVWHLIGQLQTNKARSAVSYAHLVESVDRLKLVAALDAAAERAQRTVDCLVQVNLDPSAQGRGGAGPEEVEAVADAVARSRTLRLKGLMAVAPLGGDPRPAFERLALLHGKVRAAHPGAVHLSAGMSADLEAAVDAGSTHVRIGSALFGSRPAAG
jgi:pyridoxal phosphate enzyme (YggS family)